MSGQLYMGENGPACIVLRAKRGSPRRLFAISIEGRVSLHVEEDTFYRDGRAGRNIDLTVGAAAAHDEKRILVRHPRCIGIVGIEVATVEQARIAQAWHAGIRTLLRVLEFGRWVAGTMLR